MPASRLAYGIQIVAPQPTKCRVEAQARATPTNPVSTATAPGSGTGASVERLSFIQWPPVPLMVTYETDDASTLKYRSPVPPLLGGGTWQRGAPNWSGLMQRTYVH